MRRALLPSALLAAALAALATACGGASLDPVAAAASKTADAGSFRFSFSMSLGAGGAQQQQPMLKGEGGFDASARRLQLQMSVAGTDVEAILDASAATPALYFREPAGTSKLPAGKTWAKIDLAAAAKQQGLDLGKLTSAQLDPSQLVQALKQAGTSTKVGEEQVDGVQTTHYRVQLDPKKALGKASAKQQQAAGQALKLLGGSTFPVDVWVDGSGLLRRVGFDFGGQGSLFSIHAQLDLRDYGSDVSVPLPPAAEVADAPLPSTLPSLLKPTG